MMVQRDRHKYFLQVAYLEVPQCDGAHAAAAAHQGGAGPRPEGNGGDGRPHPRRAHAEPVHPRALDARDATRLRPRPRGVMELGDLLVELEVEEHRATVAQPDPDHIQGGRGREGAYPRAAQRRELVNALARRKVPELQAPVLGADQDLVQVGVRVHEAGGQKVLVQRELTFGLPVEGLRALTLLLGSA